MRRARDAPSSRRGRRRSGQRRAVGGRDGRGDGESGSRGPRARRASDELGPRTARRPRRGRRGPRHTRRPRQRLCGACARRDEQHHAAPPGRRVYPPHRRLRRPVLFVWFSCGPRSGAFTTVVRRGRRVLAGNRRNSRSSRRGAPPGRPLRLRVGRRVRRRDGGVRRRFERSGTHCGMRRRLHRWLLAQAESRRLSARRRAPSLTSLGPRAARQARRPRRRRRGPRRLWEWGCWTTRRRGSR
mmetsp:Transcript_5296/g.21852  ORF Transcript_5296/g.21852 Transcript_5296/m.21852 type:complete len:242 (+) Transcript_5296:1132-1857(+)